MIKKALASAACVLAMIAVSPAVGQFAPIVSPPPEGLHQNEGAGFPKGHYAQLENLPDWGGIWFLSFEMPAAGSAPPPQPKLKGEYLKRYDAWRAEALANHGDVKRTKSNCSPPGMPVFMQIPQYPFEYLFTPGRVTVNQEAWMQTRKIWTDGRTHSDDIDPSYNGHSIGHWEGDTLVVDTVGIDDSLEINQGMGHSDKLHVVERIHLAPDNPDKLVDEIWMEDPEALAEPYSTKVSYTRDRYGSLLEFQCSQNDRNPVNENGETELR